MRSRIVSAETAARGRRFRFGTACLVAAGLVAVGSVPLEARTWNVSPDGLGDAPTIAAALDSSVAGDDVVAACGTYFEHGLVVPEGVVLRGVASDPACVTIDAQGAGRILLLDGVTDATRVEFVRLANGAADNAGGGGALVRGGSSARFADCVFLDNSGGQFGGGLRAIEGSAPRLDRCTFEGNVAEFGGGLQATASSPDVADCVFRGNGAAFGGGLLFSSVSAGGIERCVFEENAAGFDGGGLYLLLSPAPVSDCVFVRNAAAFDGGAIALDESSGSLSGLTLVENQAPSGAGLWLFRASPDISNTIVAFGTAGGAVSCDALSVPSVECTDVFGNAGGDWVACFAGLETVNGNLTADPLFCDPSAGDFTLDSASPCLPANNACGELVGALGAGCGGGVGVEPSIALESWGRIKSRWR